MNSFLSIPQLFRGLQGKPKNLATAEGLDIISRLPPELSDDIVQYLLNDLKYDTIEGLLRRQRRPAQL